MSVKTVLSTLTVTGSDQLGPELSTTGRLRNPTWVFESDGQVTINIDFDILMQDGTWAQSIFLENTGSPAASLTAGASGDVSHTGLCLPGSLAEDLTIFGIRSRVSITSIFEPVKLQISAIDE